MKWLKFFRWSDCNTGTSDNNDVVENLERDCGDDNVVGIGDHNDGETDGANDGLDIDSKNNNERIERNTDLDLDDRDDRDDDNAHDDDTDCDDNDRDDNERDDCSDLDSDRSDSFDEFDDDRGDKDCADREHDDDNDLDTDRGDSFDGFDGFNCL